jgi:hypothetical protein
MTYLYETIPAREGGIVKQFEIKQGANEAALTKHPETGEAVRRVILGGCWLVKQIEISGTRYVSGLL